ncbi:hypothetical protein [Pyxidicoccus sp. MSG2]|uniref:hypothetical protein n=1 Tax=Pyxidicoccus sp. MSG2 TaxID=2996790 RepID=UPI002270BFFE|nr:hypothetical protein [Pyxidicoccus sp. MSG2]MCY1020118.1 hypothetical protein [Pyxidicoccus sp. MSG2]
MKRAGTWLAAVAVLGLMVGCGGPVSEESQAPLSEQPTADSNVSAQACDTDACICNRYCRLQCGTTNPTCFNECYANCI